MPIYGVGIDLVRVERLEALLKRWGQRFETRVFTEFERQFCSGRKNRTSCLALRFAAKEAFVKALGLGMRKPVLWRDIEVKPDPLGKPEISLTPRALEYCEEKGIRSWHLSLTDEGEYGAAVVVLETR
jgi:holo-[acyl-carrier protein] synthase